MSVSTDQAHQAARDTLRQAVSGRTPQLSACVTNIRPLRGEVYDVNAELRQCPLDAYAWTLVTIGLRKLESQTASDLADLIEARLQHPSAAVPS